MMSLRSRLLWRFGTLTVVCIVFSWVSAFLLISRDLNRRMERQLERLGRTLAEAPFILNAAALTHVEQLVEAQVAVFRSDGSILVVSPGLAQTHERLGAMLAALAPWPAGKVRTLSGEWDGYRALWVPVEVPGYGSVRLGLAMSAKEMARLNHRLMVSLSLIAAVGLAAVALAGTLMAQRVTAPLKQLVEAATALAEGRRENRVRTHGDAEIVQLSEAFNTMINRLAVFEKRLVAAERYAAAGETAAELAHEIRNPLTSIKMLLQIVQDRFRDALDLQDLLDPVLQEVNRLENCVRHSLDRTGAVTLAAKPLSLTRLVQSVADLAEPSMRSQDIVVRVALFQEELLVRGDEERLKQVIWNLLENARQAMPNGGRLDVSVRSAGFERVQVTVEDSGDGLPPCDPEELTRAFFTTRENGLGLGLSVSRRIVEYHGGELLLESRQEGGSRAVVRLPLWRGESETNG